MPSLTPSDGAGALPVSDPLGTNAPTAPPLPPPADEQLLPGNVPTTGEFPISIGVFPNPLPIDPQFNPPTQIDIIEGDLTILPAPIVTTEGGLELTTEIPLVAGTLRLTAVPSPSGGAANTAVLFRDAMSHAGNSADFNSIPEPSSMLLAAAALVGLSVRACWRCRAVSSERLDSLSFQTRWRWLPRITKGGR
jgi:hypothetical protein